MVVQQIFLFNHIWYQICVGVEKYAILEWPITFNSSQKNALFFNSIIFHKLHKSLAPAQDAHLSHILGQSFYDWFVLLELIEARPFHPSTSYSFHSKPYLTLGMIIFMTELNTHKYLKVLIVTTFKMHRQMIQWY